MGYVVLGSSEWRKKCSMHRANAVLKGSVRGVCCLRDMVLHGCEVGVPA